MGKKKGGDFFARQEGLHVLQKGTLLTIMDRHLEKTVNFLRLSPLPCHIEVLSCREWHPFPSLGITKWADFFPPFKYHTSFQQLSNSRNAK